MAIVSLINISLDITANISWWILKNSVYGTYYIYTYFIPPKPTPEEIELLALRTELTSLNRQLYLLTSIHNNPSIVNRNNIHLDTSIDDKDFELISDTEL